MGWRKFLGVCFDVMERRGQGSEIGKRFSGATFAFIVEGFDRCVDVGIDDIDDVGFVVGSEELMGGISLGLFG